MLALRYYHVNTLRPNFGQRFPSCGQFWSIFAEDHPFTDWMFAIRSRRLLPMGERNGTVTGAKLLNCLEVLAQSKAGLSVSEIATATGLSRSSAGRLLETLSRCGYVTKDRDKKHRLSLRIFELGSR